MNDQERKPIVVDSPQQQSFIDEREPTAKGSGKHNQGQRSKLQTVVKTVVKEKIKTEAKPRKKDLTVSNETSPGLPEQEDIPEEVADPAPPMVGSDSESEADDDEESGSDVSDREEKKVTSKELRAYCECLCLMFLSCVL